MNIIEAEKIIRKDEIKKEKKKIYMKKYRKDNEN